MFTQAAIQRKSVRNYSPQRFSDELKAQIGLAVKSLVPLYDDAQTNFKFCPANTIREQVKGNLVKAPYYIIISAKKADGFLENVGFMAEQLVIWLTQQGIGSCYCGMGRPAGGAAIADEYCITLALGFPAEKESFRASEAEFKRKELSAYLIGDGENDFLEPFIRFARLAPSAVNAQPVVFEMDGGSIKVFRKKPLLSKLEKMQRIDTGIALAHIFMYAWEKGYHIDFYKDGKTRTNRMIYFLTLNILEEVTDE
ncbi:MAG: hypothetical protein E7517_08165 [Ruminococcaceae bacterium]|nr:hypothetical protein [Oscillospiraceae bacterium]